MADFTDMEMTVADFRQDGAEACARERLETVVKIPQTLSNLPRYSIWPSSSRCVHSGEQPPRFMLLNREWKGAGG